MKKNIMYQGYVAPGYVHILCEQTMLFDSDENLNDFCHKYLILGISL